MPRKPTDLQALPRWAQYTIAAVLMGAITIAGYFSGRDQPTPEWIKTGLIPTLGWLGLLLIAIVLVSWFRRRR
jgi:hypothetical protein